MKSPTKKATLLKDYERLASWRNGICPYCGSEELISESKPTKEMWWCFVCGNQNNFSGTIVNREVDERR